MDNTWLYASLAGLTATVGMAWGYARGLFQKLSGYVIVRSNITGFSAWHLVQYLESNGTEWRSGPRDYWTAHLFVRPWKQYWHVPVELTISTLRIFRLNSKPIWFRWASPIQDTNQMKLELCSFRGTIHHETLLRHACEFAKDAEEQRALGMLHSGRFSRHRVSVTTGTASRNNAIGVGGTNPRPANDPPSAYPGDQSSKAINIDSAFENNRGRPLLFDRDQLYYTRRDESQKTTELQRIAAPEFGMEIVEELRTFLKSKDWYTERGITWKRSYLLYGPPGCGKTTFIRAVAEELDMPLQCHLLSTFTDQDLQIHWNDESNKSYSRMILLEDIDTVFRSRTGEGSREYGREGLSFELFLQLLDGVQQTQGLILFMTTNHPEMLDEALCQIDSEGTASRPGRIDRAVKFGLPTAEGLQHIAQQILPELSTLEIEQLAFKNVGKSGAQFQELCVRKALDMYWNDRTESQEIEVLSA